MDVMWGVLTYEDHAALPNDGRRHEIHDGELLTPTTIVQPDLVFIAADRAAIISARGIEGAPTLAGEILSPDARAIEVHRLAAGGYGMPDPRTGDGLAPFDELTLDGEALWS